MAKIAWIRENTKVAQKLRAATSQFSAGTNYVKCPQQFMLSITLIFAFFDHHRGQQRNHLPVSEAEALSCMISALLQLFTPFANFQACGFVLEGEKIIMTKKVTI